eukprot:m.5483 g.5483  ORF g.5483 m.5483 type:complete len:73 (+) comp7694_c0_seq2:143-361(+)
MPTDTPTLTPTRPTSAVAVTGSSLCRQLALSALARTATLAAPGPTFKQSHQVGVGSPNDREGCHRLATRSTR